MFVSRRAPPARFISGTRSPRRRIEVSPTSGAESSSSGSTTRIGHETAEGGEDAILGDLAWLAIDFDEGPVRQSERGELYAEAAGRAIVARAAEHDREGAVRLRGDGATLLRADGTATYQLASVVDDLELAISHVLRGSDHRPNLELQQRIARALGGELPEVLHHGLVLGADGKKLSKGTATPRSLT